MFLIYIERELSACAGCKADLDSTTRDRKRKKRKREGREEDREGCEGGVEKYRFETICACYTAHVRAISGNSFYLRCKLLCLPSAQFNFIG